MHSSIESWMAYLLPAFAEFICDKAPGKPKIFPLICKCNKNKSIYRKYRTLYDKSRVYPEIFTAYPTPYDGQGNMYREKTYTVPITVLPVLRHWYVPLPYVFRSFIWKTKNGWTCRTFQKFFTYFTKILFNPIIAILRYMYYSIYVLF